MMTLWMFVAGLGALALSLGLFGIAKSWFGTACAALTFICALALLVLASEEANRDRVERCKNMGGLWHPVDGGGICVTSDGKVLFSD